MNLTKEKRLLSQNGTGRKLKTIEISHLQSAFDSILRKMLKLIQNIANLELSYVKTDLFAICSHFLLPLLIEAKGQPCDSQSED